jgi:Ca2+-transporting ATPase
MKWHEIGPEEVLQSINTSRENGLTEKDVQKRVKHHGFNELKEAEKRVCCANILMPLQSLPSY